jgi:Reverse transcriptase (RNA-dependent DNA polymerase)
MIWNQMKQLLKSDRKKIIEELAIKFLKGPQLVAMFRKLDADMMYISRRKALQLPLDVVTYQGRQEDIALVDSGATNNFIDARTVKKLNLGTQKVPQPIELYNVDGTHNQDGKVEQSVHLYIDNGEQRVRTQFFVTNLGKDCIILGYPWFEAFNPKINWKEGKLLGPRIKLKTMGAVNREHVNEAYEIRQTTMELRKMTIAQKMAEAFQTNKPKMDTPIPPEYKRHEKVFSEQEAKRFPSSRTWDHQIPLKADAPDTINEKVYNLPKAGKQAIEEWVYKMLKKGFIEQSDSRYGHTTFMVPKKEGLFQIVQDYRPVNRYTKKDTTPLSNIQDAIESLGDKVLFSKFDIWEGYNNIQLVPKDRWKAAFKTHIGLFQPTVMVFRLQGAPGTFLRMIAVNVAPMYREFPPDRFKHYMDDCLVATAEGELTLHHHMNHRLLNIFEEHSYFLKPSKCEFEHTEIDFLGVCLGHRQITIDPSKIAGIKEWPRTLKSVKEVCSTLGILGFQRPFIPGFADLAKLLTRLLKKDSTFL